MGGIVTLAVTLGGGWLSLKEGLEGVQAHIGGNPISLAHVVTVARYQLGIGLMVLYSAPGAGPACQRCRWRTRPAGTIAAGSRSSGLHLEQARQGASEAGIVVDGDLHGGRWLCVCVCVQSATLRIRCSGVTVTPL